MEDCSRCAGSVHLITHDFYCPSSASEFRQATSSLNSDWTPNTAAIFCGITYPKERFSKVPSPPDYLPLFNAAPASFDSTALASVRSPLEHTSAVAGEELPYALKSLHTTVPMILSSSGVRFQSECQVESHSLFAENDGPAAR